MGVAGVRAPAFRRPPSHPRGGGFRCPGSPHSALPSRNGPDRPERHDRTGRHSPGRDPAFTIVTPPDGVIAPRPWAHPNKGWVLLREDMAKRVEAAATREKQQFLAAIAAIAIGLTIHGFVTS